MNSLKQLRESLRVPKEGKISDKTFTYNMVASVLGLVLCLFLLSATTFAWYKDGISSEKTSISPASCVVNVFVMKTDGASSNAAAEILLEPDDEVTNDISYSQNFEKNVTYKIRLTASGTVGSRGYCKIEIGDGVYYYTAPVISGEESVVFYLTFDEDVEDVKFYSRWGIYSGIPDIRQGDSCEYSEDSGLSLISDTLND